MFPYPFKVWFIVLTYSEICHNKFDSVTNIDAPRLNKNSFGNVSALANTFQLFTCSVISGSKPIIFTWMRNDRPISESDGVHIETNDMFSLLTLKSIKQTDSAHYTCQASNVDGSDSVTIHLMVKGLAMIIDQSVLFYDKTWRYGQGVVPFYIVSVSWQIIFPITIE